MFDIRSASARSVSNRIVNAGDWPAAKVLGDPNPLDDGIGRDIAQVRA
jgi:hypothetical protein